MDKRNAINRINNFIEEFLDFSFMNVSETPIEEGDRKFSCFYKKIRNSGINGPAIQLWDELWEKYGGRFFCLAIYFGSKKTFNKYFSGNVRCHKPYYKEKCYDVDDDDVEIPPCDNLTLQKAAENEYYLCLYIKKGHERESVEKFFTHNLVKKICNLDDEMVTERLQQSWARIGQGNYRDDMLDLWRNACSVTECSIKETLVASHAKPWRDCEPEEKTDPHNGLLLTANLDALFDKYLITFDENWKIVIASGLELECKKLGITSEIRVKYEKLKECDQKKVQKFLKIHRKKFGEKNRAMKLVNDKSA